MATGTLDLLGELNRYPDLADFRLDPRFTLTTIPGDQTIELIRPGSFFCNDVKP